MLSGPGEAGKSTVTVALADAARDGGAACGLHVARSRESGQGVGGAAGGGRRGGAVRGLSASEVDRESPEEGE